MNRRRLLPVLVLSVLAAIGPGCATIVGTVTGAFTNAVDMPRLMLDPDRHGTEPSPDAVPLIALVFVPIGIVTGPVLGLAKGLYVDVWGGLRDNFDYGDAWGYGPESVWRPSTFQQAKR